MAQMHGGSVSVNSQPGEGSTFTIAMPWRKVSLSSSAQDTIAASMTHEALTDAASVHRPTVLVVDNQQQSRSWLEALITSQGYDVLFAANSNDALQFAAAGQPSLLFVDLQTVSREELFLINDLTNNHQSRPIPLIVMSALGLPGEAERALAVGAVAFCVKPLGREELRHLLNKHSLETTSST